jgi:hypothetical protein
VKNAIDEQLQQTIVLDYLKEEILSFVNNGTQRVFTLEYVNTERILGGADLTEDRLMQSFYIVESVTGKRVSKMQKKLLLRGIDYNELTQQRGRMVYLIRTHPTMVLKELPKTSAPEVEKLIVKEPFYWGAFFARITAISAALLLTGVFFVGLFDSVKYVASLFY